MCLRHVPQCKLRYAYGIAYYMWQDRWMVAHLPVGNTRRTTKGGIKHNDLRGTSWGWMGGQTFNHQLTASANDFVWWFMTWTYYKQISIYVIFLHWKLFCFDFNMSWVHTSPTNSTSSKLWLHNGNTFVPHKTKNTTWLLLGLGYLQDISSIVWEYVN